MKHPLSVRHCSSTGGILPRRNQTRALLERQTINQEDRRDGDKSYKEQKMG